MRLLRRRLLKLLAGAAALPAALGTGRALAQAYPSRPVRIVVGFPPGGGNDLYARLIAQGLSERLRQPFVVENRPGAGGTLATDAVARAPADGYTLLLADTGEAWNTTLYPHLKFDFIRDFAPVGTIARGFGVLTVPPALAINSVLELITAAKAKPGSLLVASSGVGGIPFMYWELFKNLTGVDMVHVPFRGAALALAEVLAGRVQLIISGMPPALGYIRAGKLRALAVTGPTRAAALPDVPAVAESVKGYEASTWWGIVAPRATSAEIVAVLHRAINASLADPDTRARIAALGDSAFATEPAEFAKLIADDTEKWAKVIRVGNINAE